MVHPRCARAPYNAIEIKEEEEKVTVYIIEALCKGCGVCGTACLIKAVTSGHFTTEEIMAQVKTTLMEEVKA